MVGQWLQVKDASRLFLVADAHSFHSPGRRGVTRRLQQNLLGRAGRGRGQAGKTDGWPRSPGVVPDEGNKM